MSSSKAELATVAGPKLRRRMTKGDILKLVNFCKIYFRAAATAEAIGNFNKLEALHNRNQGDASSIRLAPQLLDLTCRAIADMITAKRGQEILEMFETKDDFTSEEEAEFLEKIERALDQ